MNKEISSQKKDHQLYWEDETSSRNRSDSPIYLANKAVELSALVKMYNPDGVSVVDLGCGAGELLFHLIHYLNIATAIDYSDSMLTVAKKNISSSKGVPVFLKKDVLNFSKEINEHVWVTTGAASQYLNSIELRELITNFKENENGKSFYLFDTIDPVRYRVNPWGNGYIQTPRKNLKLKIYSLYKKIVGIYYLCFQANKRAHELDSAAMGYAYLPSFWLDLAQDIGLNVEIVSSRYFEYRYHVILRKTDGA